jgi:hypothetical protein
LTQQQRDTMSGCSPFAPHRNSMYHDRSTQYTSEHVL